MMNLNIETAYEIYGTEHTCDMHSADSSYTLLDIRQNSNRFRKIIT